MDTTYQITDYFPNEPKIRSPLSTLWFELRIRENPYKRAVPTLNAVTPYPGWARYSLEQVIETIGTANENILEARLESLYVHTFSYFMLLRVLFERIAMATRYFYPSLQLSPSFSKQLKYFEKNRSVDLSYVTYLQDSLIWYPHFKKLRDKLCHPHLKMEHKFTLDTDFLINALKNEGCPEFENLSFADYLKRIYRKTYHFLYFYEDHFMERCNVAPTAKDPEMRYVYWDFMNADNPAYVFHREILFPDSSS